MSRTKLSLKRNGLSLIPALLMVLPLAGCGGGSAGGGTNPPPPPLTLTTATAYYGVSPLTQTFAIAGQSQFTLIATGTGFTQSTVLRWNGSSLATTYRDSTNISAPVTAAMIAAPGTVPVSATDTSTSVTSNSLSFGIASQATATAGVVAMITVGPDGSPANADSLVAPSISATGRYIAFQSAATNLGAGPSSAYEQIYERDTCIGAPTGCSPSTIPISVTTDGSAPNGQSRESSISGDGRYVSYDSNATNILDAEGLSDICNPTGSSCTYMRDTCIGAVTECKPTTSLISTTVADEPANGSGPSVGANSRYVAFESSGQSPGNPQEFLRDTCNSAPSACTPSTSLLSVSNSGETGNSGSFSQSVSSTGRFVAFQSYATNLIPNDSNIYSDIFLRDTCLGAPSSCTPSTTRESISYNGAQENDSLDSLVLPSISGDGRLIAYASDATNLVPQNVGIFGDIYLRDTCFGAIDTCTPTTSLASLGNDGSIPNASQNNQSMSADGRFIAFASLASNLVPGDTFSASAWKDIFVRDTCFGAPASCNPSTVRVSVATTPTLATQSNKTNDFPRISGDGHYLIFLSSATNYLASGGNGHTMVYLAKTGF